MDQEKLVTIGNFLFKWRNKLVPLAIIILFLMAHPLVTGPFIKTLALSLAIGGLALRGIVIGYAYIKRGGVNKKVYAADLVTDGMFGVCRNPLYVGNVLIYTGLFLFHGHPLVIVLGVPMFLFFYVSLVAAEEAYLANKFGEGYQEYCRDVPRWSLKLSRFEESTKGMTFNVWRVITKDYTTAATTLITLTLTEVYRYVTLPTRADIPTMYIAFLGLMVVGFGVAVLAIKKMKKASAAS